MTRLYSKVHWCYCWDGASLSGQWLQTCICSVFWCAVLNMTHIKRSVMSNRTVFIHFLRECTHECTHKCLREYLNFPLLIRAWIPWRHWSQCLLHTPVFNQPTVVFCSQFATRDHLKSDRNFFFLLNIQMMYRFSYTRQKVFYVSHLLIVNTIPYTLRNSLETVKALSCLLCWGNGLLSDWRASCLAVLFTTWLEF